MRQHPPVRVIWSQLTTEPLCEHFFMLCLMRLCGDIDKVRGHAFCREHLTVDVGAFTGCAAVTPGRRKRSSRRF